MQEDLNLPGLMQECRDFLVMFGITNIRNYSEAEWKHLVKDEIFKMNRNDILEDMKGYKKIDSKD